MCPFSLNLPAAPQQCLHCSLNCQYLTRKSSSLFFCPFSTHTFPILRFPFVNMKFTCVLAVAILPLAHSMSTKRSQSLPTVDLGYEIHQAIYYDVSISSEYSTLCQTSTSPSTSFTTSATFGTLKLRSDLYAGHLPRSL